MDEKVIKVEDLSQIKPQPTEDEVQDDDDDMNSGNLFINKNTVL